MAITLVHDCDVERRASPTALNGDWRDCYLEELGANNTHDGTQIAAGIQNVAGKNYNERRALLLFNLTKFIPAGATITTAVWHFYVLSTTTTGFMTFTAYRIRRHDWKEDEATWNAFKEPWDSGDAESGGNNTLTDTDKSWTTDEWKNMWVRITAGTGAGQFRTVTGNNGTTLTVTPNWATNPDSTSLYVVGQLWQGAGASNTAQDRDQSVSAALGPLNTTGWKAKTVTALVTDAWSNRSGICTFIVERTDTLTTTVGEAYIDAKNAYPYAPERVHHLRVTYALDGKTFQVMVR